MGKRETLLAYETKQTQREQDRYNAEQEAQAKAEQTAKIQRLRDEGKIVVEGTGGAYDVYEYPADVKGDPELEREYKKEILRGETDFSELNSILEARYNKKVAAEKQKFYSEHPSEFYLTYEDTSGTPTAVKIPGEIKAYGPEAISAWKKDYLGINLYGMKDRWYWTDKFFSGLHQPTLDERILEASSGKSSVENLNARLGTVGVPISITEHNVVPSVKYGTNEVAARRQQKYDSEKELLIEHYGTVAVGVEDVSAFVAGGRLHKTTEEKITDLDRATMIAKKSVYGGGTSGMLTESAIISFSPSVFTEAFLAGEELFGFATPEQHKQKLFDLRREVFYQQYQRERQQGPLGSALLFAFESPVVQLPMAIGIGKVIGGTLGFLKGISPWAGRAGAVVVGGYGAKSTYEEGTRIYGLYSAGKVAESGGALSLTSLSFLAMGVGAKGSYKTGIKLGERTKLKIGGKLNNIMGPSTPLGEAKTGLSIKALEIKTGVKRPFEPMKSAYRNMDTRLHIKTLETKMAIKDVLQKPFEPSYMKTYKSSLVHSSRTRTAARWIAEMKQEQDIARTPTWLDSRGGLSYQQQLQMETTIQTRRLTYMDFLKVEHRTKLLNPQIAESIEGQKAIAFMQKTEYGRSILEGLEKLRVNTPSEIHIQVSAERRFSYGNELALMRSRIDQNIIEYTQWSVMKTIRQREPLQLLKGPEMPMSGKRVTPIRTRMETIALDVVKNRGLITAEPGIGLAVSLLGGIGKTKQIMAQQNIEMQDQLRSVLDINKQKKGQGLKLLQLQMQGQKQLLKVQQTKGLQLKQIQMLDQKQLQSVLLQTPISIQKLKLLQLQKQRQIQKQKTITKKQSKKQEPKKSQAKKTIAHKKRTARQRERHAPVELLRII